MGLNISRSKDRFDKYSAEFDTNGFSHKAFQILTFLSRKAISDYFNYIYEGQEEIYKFKYCDYKSATDLINEIQIRINDWEKKNSNKIQVIYGYEEIQINEMHDRIKIWAEFSKRWENWFERQDTMSPEEFSHYEKLIAKDYEFIFEKMKMGERAPRRFIEHGNFREFRIHCERFDYFRAYIVSHYTFFHSYLIATRSQGSWFNRFLSDKLKLDHPGETAVRYFSADRIRNRLKGTSLDNMYKDIDAIKKELPQNFFLTLKEIAEKNSLFPLNQKAG